MMKYLRSDSCMRMRLLEYFEEHPTSKLQNTLNCCSNCTNHQLQLLPEKKNFASDGLIIFNAIKNSYSATQNKIVNIIWGSKNKRFIMAQNHKSFGLGKSKRIPYWNELIQDRINNFTFHNQLPVNIKKQSRSY